MAEERGPGEVEIGGVRYEMLIGNDDREGLFVEVQDSEGSFLLEVFRPFDGGGMTLTASRAALPLEVVEHAIAAAKQNLRWRWEEE